LWTEGAPARGQQPLPPSLLRAEEAVVIVLRPEAVPQDSVVTLADVAVLSGGSSRVREKLARLDVADAATVGVVRLTQPEVRYRLLLAGYTDRQFQLQGSPITFLRVSCGEVSEKSLLEAARKVILQRLPGMVERLTLAPAEPIVVPAVSVGVGQRIRLQGYLPTGKVPLGRVSVAVAIFVNGERREVVPVHLDVAPRAEGAGESWRGLAQVPDSLTPVAIVNPTPTEGPVLIKNRDVVRMIANVGTASFVVSGEAMQDGRSGQAIRVRNVDSNKMVHARVVGTGIVEVD
jgi:hypothetical protein